MALALALAFGFGGGLIAWAYFLLMRMSLARLGGGRGNAMRFVLLALARVALFGGGLVGAILVSGWCLVAYTLGFIVVRTIIVGKVERQASFSSPGSEEEKGAGG